MDYNILTIKNSEVIRQKAATKRNGVFTFRGIHYRVRDGKVTHYACAGEIVEPCGYFSVCIGKYDYQAYGHHEKAKQCLLRIK